ncbi:Trp biosynthesis-associated membrane protein [Microbacterium sp. NPDC056234]|uniref:Trp biosynthesis-associated membrane protein n=1 Tax=Microbacterium sp. NPDC056234 TaxID=3345757 RepID=UPI0035D90914
MSLARRGRSVAVLGFLVAGGLGVLSSTQTWLVAARHDAAEPILVTGAQALPLLTPLSLAVLALAAVLAIVGPILRYVLAALGAVIGVLLAWSTLGVLLSHPLGSVASTVTEVTGLAGDAAIADLVDAVEPTAWPAIALAGWVILAASAVFVILTARGWKTGGRRFRTDTDERAASGPVDAIDSWDELSRGTDPTR